MARPNRSREAILEAAAALAASRGISATTMDEIAVRAGVAKGSVYYNFAGKDELFGALFEEARAKLVPLLEEAAQGEGRAPLEGIVRTLLGRLEANPDLAKLLVAEVFRSDRNWAETVGAFRDAVAGCFRRALLAARPELGADGHAMVPAVSVFGATLMSGLEWLAFEPERTLDEVAGALLDLLAPRPAA